MVEDLQSLNKDAITAAKRYMGGVAWFTVGFTFCVVVAYAGNLALFALGVIPVWLATTMMAVLTYMSYTPLHEAVHGNIHGNVERLQWLNDLCGYAVAPLISNPYASHRYEHFTHHRYTNIEGKDPDFVISGLGRGIFPAFKAVFKFIWIQSGFFALNRWGTASFREKAVYCIELLFALAWRVAFIVLVDQPGVAVVVLLGGFLGSAFTGYWFAYRPHLPYREPLRYKNTNSLIMPGWMKPVEWFWLGQNLHSVHHLFPRVPFYKYHALHAEIEPALRAHGTPIIGVFDRQPKAGK
ncbi:Uncharacterised protein [Halioglobus japonicus]|nr:Uncharacterised protein [Halioglobus japonicus]